ncbi:uncharacterized protein LOC129761144 [Toxorhynchites rutilus septentrionalis]|uniref:uncharacterized protein LOC129761144 n=1 Tax=Toxorhynchites rutilus septentrionalis TaxID=329112 RepID=UPI00247921D4|nr:uncharacterized protein LOC129761144 [Toxorhynchites rutilus septentrionalis]
MASKSSTVPDEKRLKAKETKRKNLVDSLKRIERFLHDYVPEQHLHEVPLRLERLEKVWESYEVVQEELEELDDSEDAAQKNLEMRAQVEELYLRVKAGLASKIPSPPPTPAIAGFPAAPAAQPVFANIKLPAISLPEFDGDFNNWLTFHDTFVSMIHSSTEIPHVQKFHYLRAALKGEAANLVQSISITANNYAVAWQTLVNRYSNKAILRKKHIRALLKHPKISSHSVESLHKIVDEFQRHTKVLEQLGEPVDQFSSILIELLEDKLDDASLTAWEESIAADQQPTYAKMVDFLQKRARVLETISINRPQHSGSKNPSFPPPKKPNQPRLSSNAANTVPGRMYPLCPACGKQKHSIFDCSVFNGLDTEGRLKVVSDKKLCSNCFRSDHFARNCRSNYSCKHCSKRHHSMIHPGPFEATRGGPENKPTNNPEGSGSSLVTAVAALPTPEVVTTLKVSNASVLLTTVVLIVVDAYGQGHIARALLDTGSQPNAMSERLCQMLHLPRKIANVAIAGVDSTVTNAKYEVRAEIRSRVAEFSDTLDFLVLRKVTRDTPSSSFPTVQWKLPESFSLADPDFNTSRRVDMIIGAAHFYSYLRDGRFRLPSQGPMLVETVFGWIVTGKFENLSGMSSRPTVTCHAATVTSLSEQLERFWRVEEVQGPNYSVDEQQCEDYYRETVSRDPTGRYVVRMPKHPEHDQMIGQSKPTALRRFRWLEQKLLKDENLRTQYHEFMREYVSLGQMAPVQEDEEDVPNACYLPHHPVVKESSSTTKIRVVFDGSAKTTSGHSLNDSLLVGPVVQDELLTLILRFRKFPVALVADVEKMYRQVSMHPLDRPLQRILWRFDSSQPIQTYELGTVTYGLAPSSFLATRTLLQLVGDEGTPFPKASTAVKKHIYVDDLISGDDSIEDAIQLRDELSELLQKGGFRFRKWCSNSLPVLAGLSPELLGTQSSLKFDPEESVKTLGIRWEPEADVFRFDVSVVLKDQLPTKRSILSAIAQLYDPLGIIAPVVVQAKILMQHLWLLALDWDDEVSPDLQQKWARFCEQLPHLSNFRIERFAFTARYATAEIHCFADASESAYGACIYVRSETADGLVQVNLLASKSRVAPLKPLSIPRLELCAALLASRLYEKILNALDMSFSASFFWSDSTVVLQWMKAPPRTWKTFVANRIAEIQATTNGSNWQHVSGHENPADMVSRGVSAEELINSELWKHGPSWLREEKSSWPSRNVPEEEFTAKELELKQNTILNTQVLPPNSLFEQFSSYSALIRAVSYCFRFTHNTRNRGRRISSRVLSVAEMRKSKVAVVKLVQAEAFPEDRQRLKRGHTVSSKSPLRLLNPFLDNEGLVRVGGRLNLSDAPYDVKHQIVVPGFHPFTQLLLKHHHRKLVHGGITMTLSVVRDEFWPLNGRKAVRSAIRKCYECCRANPKPIQQPIGQLPVARVTANEAFACTGVDYCGPIYLKPIHRRTAARKSYICVFVCLSTKAVHLELVSDLSTAAFLMALDRFVGRHTSPQHIYSDNGTNFVGAKNALHEIYTMLQSGTEVDRISNHLAEDNIQWHLIPPRAPNFGGLWEAAVKVAKVHLARQLGSSLLSFEELTTVLVRIERAMNSRPLQPLSSDHNDIAVLTPAHFLGRNINRSPLEVDVRDVPLNRLTQYQKLQKHVQNFWYRWRNEYMKELNMLYKINPKDHKLNVGDIVIIKDDALPSVRWPLARIIELHPGPDGVTRVVTLRTPNGVFKRAVCKVCPLECSGED